MLLIHQHPNSGETRWQCNVNAKLCVYHVMQLTIRDLLPWMRDNLLTERPELFMKDDSV